MATSLTLENDSSLAQGYLKVNGTTSATLTTSGITGNLTGNVTGNVTGNLTGSLTAGGSLTFATTQTATGTAVDFTGIPSWAKRITVIFNGVSSSGPSIDRPFGIRLGTSSGIETTGYVAGLFYPPSNHVTETVMFPVCVASGATATLYGNYTLINMGSNVWVYNSAVADTGANWVFAIAGGSKTLPSTLDRIRITNVNGTDTFDAGTINICYEG
jgi:hypothetical protein